MYVELSHRPRVLDRYMCSTCRRLRRVYYPKTIGSVPILVCMERFWVVHQYQNMM